MITKVVGGVRIEKNERKRGSEGKWMEERLHGGFWWLASLKGFW